MTKSERVNRSNYLICDQVAAKLFCHFHGNSNLVNLFSELCLVKFFTWNSAIKLCLTIMFSEIIGLSRLSFEEIQCFFQFQTLTVIFHIKFTHSSHLPVSAVNFLQWELTQAVDLRRAGKIIKTRLIHYSWFFLLPLSLCCCVSHCMTDS